MGPVRETGGMAGLRVGQRARKVLSGSHRSRTAREIFNIAHGAPTKRNYECEDMSAASGVSD
jgi:hypothetical protein